MDFESPATRSFRRRVLFASEFDVTGDNFSELAAAEMKRTLIVSSSCHRHNFTHHFLRETADAVTSSVRRVEEYIEANWDSPLDVEKLAQLPTSALEAIPQEARLFAADVH